MPVNISEQTAAWRKGYTYAKGEAAAEIDRLNDECSASMIEIGNLRTEIERLRMSIRWTLGEAADPEGKWFGEEQGDERTRPWRWRTHLRKISGIDEQRLDQK